MDHQFMAKAEQVCNEDVGKELEKLLGALGTSNAVVDVAVEEVEEVEEDEFIDNRGRYKELDGATAERAFEVFCRDWGNWVSCRARSLSYLKGLEQEDVSQFLLMKAWEAAADERFNGEMERGRTIISWIRQRVIWYMQNLLRQRSTGLRSSEGESLTKYKFADTDYEAEDSLCASVRNQPNDPYMFMSGSQQMNRGHHRFEAAKLLERILQEAQTMKPRHGHPIMEIIQPSSSFKMFIMKREGYSGAACYETCGVKEVMEFMRVQGIKVTREDLDNAVEILKKRIPELRSFGFMEA